MNEDLRDRRYYEKLARGWNVWVTVAIVVLLLIPLPFVRFESWPNGTLLFQQLLVPWSSFRICYTSFPDRLAIDDVYHFKWSGLHPHTDVALDSLMAISSTQPPLLKWQNRPEFPLSDLFYEGGLLQIKTCWQPVLFWPIYMLYESWRNVDHRVQGGGDS